MQRLPVGSRLRMWRAAGGAGAVAPSAHQLRLVSGSAGRGDLHTVNPLSDSLHRRRGGVYRGLTHSSQSTEIQSGQLHVRKRILHATRDASRSGSGHLRPDVRRWSFLLDSLRRGAEAAVPDELHQQLLARMNSSDAREAEHVLAALRRGQRWFCDYELNRRLPLLEDSLADAELNVLMQWPGLLRRAWIQLPPTSLTIPDYTSPLLDSGDAGVSPSQDALVTENNAPLSQGEKILDAPRLARLNATIYAVVDYEVTQKRAIPRNARAEAEWARLLKMWDENLAWHRCGPHVYSRCSAPQSS